MIGEVFQKLRDLKPLVHHITNWVTIYDCANMTRAFGALPVMAHAKEEAAEMASIASALVLNIGTLTPELIDAMVLAGKSANRKGIPVVLDAVGVGATKLRDGEALRLLSSIRIDIIKGNSSEIARLSGMEVTTKGVESAKVDADMVSVAKNLAGRYKCAVAVTGKQDIVTDGKKVYLINNGHEMMGCMVGTGCMAASIIGAFAGVEKDCAKAAAYALASFGIAGELAAAKSKGPGSFHENFYDEAYNLTAEKIEKMAKIEER